MAWPRNYDYLIALIDLQVSNLYNRIFLASIFFTRNGVILKSILKNVAAVAITQWSFLAFLLKPL